MERSAAARLVDPPTRETRLAVRTDAELLASAHCGDRAALGSLYDRHARAAYGFVRRFANREEAEDVVQATFVRLAEIAGTFDARSDSARAWVLGVAYRVACERKRQRARLVPVLAALGARDGERRQESAAHQSVDLERALARLTEGKRAVLLLTQVEGFSNEEVAAIMGLPVGTVWTRLHHARREMKRALEDAG